ncbi:DinB family protein [Amycolatopsis marina]|uniref:DinB family protein n=1 Tax=Amycolatopsis marina TaxID=490629 RepID=UPI000B864E98|nr:DinB family protein [Amycolatopsis marina]
MTDAPERPEPSKVGTEREQLTGFLDHQRATVVWKASGLTDEQARQKLVPSELTTIAGLLAHLTWVEQYWFGVVLDSLPDTWREAFEADQDAEFRVADRTPVSQLIAGYEAECERSREVAAKLDLDQEMATPRGHPITPRWVLMHMIEETARHAGHLDLLRELTDGLTGQ